MRVDVGARALSAEAHHLIAAALRAEHEIIENRERAKDQQIRQDNLEQGGFRRRIVSILETVIRFRDGIHVFPRKLRRHSVHGIAETFLGRDVAVKIVPGGKSFVSISEFFFRPTSSRSVISTIATSPRLTISNEVRILDFFAVGAVALFKPRDGNDDHKDNSKVNQRRL